MSGSVLILGGAGFIGSALARRFIGLGHDVVVIDGFCRRTGGKRFHLRGLERRIRLIPRRVEEVDNLRHLVATSRTVIDCMGWTSHLGAMNAPAYDEELNLRSHLHLIANIPTNAKAQFIYLGSRVQYGNAKVDLITEQTPSVPHEVQGIHKLAAELHFRAFAGVKHFDVASLRFANTFGPNQPTKGSDIGLVGGFIRTALAKGTIEVYGARRVRHLLYVEDLVGAVVGLDERHVTGFQAFNVAGTTVSLAELARLVVRMAKGGTVAMRALPGHIAAVDMGNAPLGDEKLRGHVGSLPTTPLSNALETTIEWFRGNAR